MKETLLGVMDNQFNGCDNVNPDRCACATWQPVICDACDEEIANGVEYYTLIESFPPWLPDDDLDVEYQYTVWHKTCDQGSAAAAEAS